MSASQPIHAVVGGTAGHIDHGKSSLVRALTGTDPDRLPEEKARGLTIDLGFANLTLSDGRRIGLVDVPGHERFVRNMVAGSTALDFAILVIAADDGVMPQTREHVDILGLLGVQRGFVALTKIDLVDEETRLLAEEDVRELLAATKLADFAIVPVSSATGAGVDEVRRRIEEIAASITPRPADGRFRMPIQRVFSLPGIGTVVTGIPLSGFAVPGKDVEFLPDGGRSRIRGIQAYGGKVERAVAGHSTALSVPDARVDKVRRGMVAAVPGTFVAGRAVDVKVRLLGGARAIPHRAPVRFHTGTSEVQGLVVLLDRDVGVGGDEVVARILLEEAVCCAPGDRFLLRLQNPVVTVGGGEVLRVLASSPRYRRLALGEELLDLVRAGDDVESRVLQHLEHAGPAGRTPGELASVLAEPEATVREIVVEHPEIFWREGVERAFLRAVLRQGIDEVLSGVERMLEARPMAASVPRSSIRTSRSLPPPLLEAVLTELEAEGRVRNVGGRLVFGDRLRELSPTDQARVQTLHRACRDAGTRPPTGDELAAATGLAGETFAGTLSRAEDEGLVVRVGDYYWDSAQVRQAMRLVRSNCLAHGGELDIPALRDHLDTSRKFLIPLLEHLDAIGFTRLRAGVRVLLPSSAIVRELEAEEGSAGAE